MQKFKEMLKCNFVNIALVFTVLLQVLLSFQGFDICDEGFSLTFYQQFFNAPESVEYNFAYWLSGLFGGIFYELYPTGGILWFRAIAILVNTGTLYLSYKLLSKYINKNIAMLGLVMAMFINDFGFLVFYHNHLTAFLAVLTIAMLVKGVTANKIGYLVCAGIIYAINIFTRLPNATLGLFILAIPLFCYLNNLGAKATFKKMLWFCLGSLLGIGFVGLILVLLGQFEIMERSVFGIFDSGNSPESNHNFATLFKVYATSIFAIFKAIIKFIGIVFVFVLGHKLLFKYKYILVVFNLLFAIIFGFLFYSNTIIPLYGIALVGGCGVLCFVENKALKIVAFLALIMALVLPFGSDGGMYNGGYMSLWLLIPIGLYFVYSLPSFNLKSIALNAIILRYATQFRGLVIIISLGYFSIKLYKLSTTAYFDEGARIEKTHTIKSKFSKGIFTTKERADIVNIILPELKKHIKPNDYLLAYESLPMLHFLTETKPFLNNPWLMIYDGYIFEKQLKNTLLTKKELPIVIQQKFYTVVNFSKPIDNYLSQTKEDLFNSSRLRNKVMNLFLENHNYNVIFENTHFVIYKTNKNI